jgi:hypothetical protein
MSSVAADTAVFDPAVSLADPFASACLAQATLRLRREVCWRWHERDVLLNAEPASQVDNLRDSLDLARYWQLKQRFFKSDPTAAYLSSRIGVDVPEPGLVSRGSFAWVQRELALDDVSTLALALGLLARLDPASGSVIAACQNDPGQREPTLALVQRLCDAPEKCLALADPRHALWRYGLVGQRPSRSGVIDWDAPIVVSPLVAERLLGFAPASSRLEKIDASGYQLSESAGPLVDLLRVPSDRLRVLPVRGRGGGSYAPFVAAVANAAGREVCRALDATHDDVDGLRALLSVAWLSGADLLLQDAQTTADQDALLSRLNALRSIPVTIYLVTSERRDVSALSAETMLPSFTVPKPTYEERVAALKGGLGRRAKGLEAAIEEAARRFRFEEETIRLVCAGLAQHDGVIDAHELFAACRAAQPMTASELAQPVETRFRPEELILPPVQQRQFDEIECAMRSLGTVHYRWGTGRVWNDSGISALFAGPSGTGKTMAAEVLAAKLDIPMYRINLAQVVDKYIGETEKNLERVFDAADVSETLLFLDECDALMGRRTEIRQSNDRWSNLQVSYLLDRLERFKGLAIMATNRRNDLDDAFVRRIRYIVEFPIPDVAQRRRIWETVIPDSVDSSEIDCEFLARQFQIAGGNIRSAAFNACLQSAARAGGGTEPRLVMEDVIVAVKREYDKLQRTISPEQFGVYASLVHAVSHGK